jgi:hypothetical protein
VLYDILVKPALRPLGANKSRPAAEPPTEYGERCREAIIAAPDDYYHQVEIVRLEAEREALLDEAATAIDTIERARRIPSRWSRHADRCMDYERQCEFFDACINGCHPSALTTLCLTDRPRPSKKHLNSSGIRALQRCPKFYKFAYEDGYAPIDKGQALSVGTYVHECLEAWWKAESGKRLEAMTSVMPHTSIDPYNLARAQAMLAGYAIKWQDEAEKYDVLGTEVPWEMSAPGKQGWKLYGTVDAMLREKSTGRLLVMEHKTTSSRAGGGEHYRQRLSMDVQVGLYLTASWHAMMKGRKP